MFPFVKEVSPNDDFTLNIAFNNGESGVLDIKPLFVYGYFEQLKDINIFKRVRVAFHTVVWDCGLDLAPEYVYEKCEKRPAA